MVILTEDRQTAPVDPYSGKTREELLNIQLAAGDGAGIQDKEAYRAAWREAKAHPSAASAHKPGRSLVLDVNIPQELKDLPQWVFWKYELKDGKWTKVPYSPDQAWKKASTTNPETWGTFDEAYKMYSHDATDGIGFVFTPPFVGVDFDHVGEEPRALEEIRAFSSYAETSPSGQGYHVICKGHLPRKGAKKGNYEIYTEGRFFTVTGEHLAGTPGTVNEAQSAIDTFLKTHINPQGGESAPTRAAAAPGPSPDEEEILRMLKNDKVAAPLMRGDISDYPSQSEADMALCCKIAFYTRDAGRIDRFFMRSGLNREKWHRKDYRDKTINKALARVTETWSPPKKRETGKRVEDVPGPVQTGPDPAIHSKAKEILENEDPVVHMMRVYNKDHMGDTLLGKSYIAMIGCQLCSNTEGIHPGTTGKSGAGKSHSMTIMLHQIPEEWIFRGSFSDQAWFYSGMKEGTIIFLDDAENLKDLHMDVIRQATSTYQEGFERKIVDAKEKKVVLMKIPPRACFFVNSAGGEYGLQFLNRQINLAVNEDHQDEIYEKQLEDGISGNRLPTKDENWQVAREMWRILKSASPVNVKIPFLDEIEWNNKENPRNYPMFQDTISAFTAIRQFQRTRDPDGYVIADRQDTRDAMEIWESISREQRTKLNTKQLGVMQKIAEMTQGKEKKEVLRADLARELPRMTSGDLTHILKGRKNPITKEFAGGLMNLVPGLDITPVTSTEEKYAETKHGDLIIYNGPFNIWGEFTPIVRWKSAGDG